jgi:hypothetical protein
VKTYVKSAVMHKDLYNNFLKTSFAKFCKACFWYIVHINYKNFLANISNTCKK